MSVGEGGGKTAEGLRRAVCLLTLLRSIGTAKSSPHCASRTRLKHRLEGPLSLGVYIWDIVVYRVVYSCIGLEYMFRIYLGTCMYPNCPGIGVNQLPHLSAAGVRGSNIFSREGHIIVLEDKHSLASVHLHIACCCVDWTNVPLCLRLEAGLICILSGIGQLAFLS